MLNPDCIHLLDLPVAAVTEPQLLQLLAARHDANLGSWLITPNLDILRQFHRSADTRALVAQADIIIADGMPLVWASRIARTPLPERVPGSALIWSLTALAAQRSWPIYLLGGNPGTAARAADVLQQRHENLRIAGTLCPPMRFEQNPDSLAQICHEVHAAQPTIVFVALGFPKQENVILHLRRLLPHAIFIGVGISFSFITGEVKRAPAWLQRLGLEWLHRLAQEPRRLFTRYIVHDLPFFFFTLLPWALRQRFKRIKPPSTASAPATST